MHNDELTMADITEGAIARWQRMRLDASKHVADQRFRTWLFETVPAQIASLVDEADPFEDVAISWEHSFIVYETTVALYHRGNIADTFLLLRWLGMHYVRHTNADLASRIVNTLTDFCNEVGGSDSAGVAAAIDVLSDVVDTAGRPVDVQVERALCRALAVRAYLYGRHSKDNRSRKTKKLAGMWSKIARRCSRSKDTVLRGRAAHAMFNTALIWLQSGHDNRARKKFATLVTTFRQECDTNTEVGEWFSRSKHATIVLDRFTVDGPELNLTYLRRQSYWDRRRLGLGFGWYWLTAGGPRNHMARLVRSAREKHRASAGQVRSWLCSGEPFVLLLRNFSLSERSGLSPSAGRFRSLFHDGSGRHTGDHVRIVEIPKCEPALTDLDTAVPLIQISNTTAGELEVQSTPGRFTPKRALYLPNRTWFETVSKLIPLASQIIVWAAELTPALSQEISCLRAHQRSNDTLVIVDEINDSMSHFLLPRRKHEPLTRYHPALSSFSHVVDAREFEGMRGPDCLPLMRIVTELETAQAVPLDQRLAKIRAYLDSPPPRSP